MLDYNMIGRDYATDRAPRGKTNGVGHAIRRLHHHYPVPAFISLASV
jgi:hypothetical protein